ncbi:unnamed protein product, partial [Rotaria magnacalcarata]
SFRFRLAYETRNERKQANEAAAYAAFEKLKVGGLQESPAIDTD